MVSGRTVPAGKAKKPLGARSPRGIVFPVSGDESRAPKGSFLYCHTMPRLTKQISEKYFRSQRITKRDSGHSARMGDLNPASHICSRHTLAFACTFDCALQPKSARFYFSTQYFGCCKLPQLLTLPSWHSRSMCLRALVLLLRHAATVSGWRSMSRAGAGPMAAITWRMVSMAPCRRGVVKTTSP